MNRVTMQLIELTIDGTAIILLVDGSYVPAHARTFGVDYGGHSIMITVTNEEKALELLQTVAVDIMISDLPNRKHGDACMLQEHALKLQPNIHQFVLDENCRRYLDRVWRRTPHAFQRNVADMTRRVEPRS